MHTSKVGNTVFLHNGDYSGEVRIVRNGKEIEVPAEDLIEFVGAMLRDRQISRLEDMTGRGYLDKREI